VSFLCSVGQFKKKIDVAKQTPHKFAFLVARKALKLSFLTLVVIVVV
jgi:hypothetical protein